MALDTSKGRAGTSGAAGSPRPAVPAASARPAAPARPRRRAWRRLARALGLLALLAVVLGGARRLAALVTGLPPEAIAVHLTRAGGGFGRRLMSDFAAEAALLAKATGRPVQVVWTREDDLRHDFYRPAGYHRLRAGLDRDGRLIAWTHHLVNPSRYEFRRDAKPPDASEMYGDDFPAGLLDSFRAEYTLARTSIPTGPWRSTLHSSNAFAVQGFLDEVAAVGGRDPLALRRELLGAPRELPFANYGGPRFATGRLRAVLDLAAEKAGWGRPLPPGRGRGIACNFTFGSYAAHVAEVTVDAGGAAHPPAAAARPGAASGPPCRGRRAAGRRAHCFTLKR